MQFNGSKRVNSYRTFGEFSRSVESNPMKIKKIASCSRSDLLFQMSFTFDLRLFKSRGHSTAGREFTTSRVSRTVQISRDSAKEFVDGGIVDTGHIGCVLRELQSMQSIRTGPLQSGH